jgi:hypothetical protein
MSLLLLLLACGTPTSPTADTSESVDSGATTVESDEANRDGACGFNRDCPADQRCECSEADGCFCADGVRGTGENGVDTCTSGEDCASALCVEGNGAFYCSDTCATDTDCGAALPTCMDIAFVGRICVRDA